jgi:hypothetical protein
MIEAALPASRPLSNAAAPTRATPTRGGRARTALTAVRRGEARNRRWAALGGAFATRARIACCAAFAVLASIGVSNPAAAKASDPCGFVSNDDVLHLLGWTVDGRQRRPYDLHGGTGSMCFISSSQGQVIVILPDPGSDYPGISVYSDPNADGLARKVYGLGAEVTLYNSTVYVLKKHRDVAVRVVPDSHAASYAEVQGFAKVLIAHLH